MLSIFMTIIKKNSFPTFLVFLFIVSLSILFTLSGCSPNQGQENQGAIPEETDNPPDQIEFEDEDQLLDDTFRIDIQTITVTFDYVPEEYYIDSYAVIKFIMRPGQTRAVIHLDSATYGTVINSIRLNDESLNISDTADVRLVDFEGTTQDGLEFQRDLEENREHTLEMSYRLTLQRQYFGFFSDVGDIGGRGNEEVFPTINTPHELARHYLTFRVHFDRNFRFIGSGLVQKQDSPGVQQWTLDTEQEVSSYTVMFVLLPAEDTQYVERNIAGVDVRIMAYNGGASIDTAFKFLEDWLPELTTNLGPFPMPRGLSIFLTTGNHGMEYYGGTITALFPLKHEVFHMYYGCSTINKTYRDSWLDEAVNRWYQFSSEPGYTPIDESYRSNIVSGRSPVAVGFDLRAYDEGAHIIQAVAEELGSRDEMIRFLSYLHRNYSFSPFTTMEFLDYLQDYSGVDMKDRFLNWLYSDEQTAGSVKSSDHYRMHKIDMTPPHQIQTDAK